MNTDDSLLAAVLACVHGLPAGHVRALASAIRSASSADAARSLAIGAVPTPAFRRYGSALVDAWVQRPDFTGPAVAMALDAALSVREHERDAEQLDLVATGPSSPHVSIRHTRAVLLELIDRAQRELICCRSLKTDQGSAVLLTEN